jgi:hypothetical protein
MFYRRLKDTINWLWSCAPVCDLKAKHGNLDPHGFRTIHTKIWRISGGSSRRATVRVSRYITLIAVFVEATVTFCPATASFWRKQEYILT